MIVRGESTIIDYHAAFDQGFKYRTILFMYIDIHIVERNKITLIYQCISVVLQPCYHV